MLIKVCGMRYPENIRAVERLGVDFMGFIFHPASPRFLERLPEYMPQGCIRTGVFVSDDETYILQTAERFSLSAIQLHTVGSAGLCRRLHERGFKVLRALGIASETDFRQTQKFEGVCDLLLFDTACKSHGGSGKRFDWRILDAYTGNTPFLLSGGIDSSCAGQINDLHHPMLAGVDLNSGFETSPAMKDAAALEKFIKAIKKQQ